MRKAWRVRTAWPDVQEGLGEKGLRYWEEGLEEGADPGSVQCGQGSAALSSRL